MKKMITKLLSALLALCMITGVFTGFLVSPAHHSHADDADGNATTDIEFDEPVPQPLGVDLSAAVTDDEWMKLFESIKYVNEEDKLSTMGKDLAERDENGKLVYTPWFEKNGFQLYASTLSGEVAVKNTKTGQVIFTNPYDVTTNIKSASIMRNMLSQLIMEYSDITTGKKTVYNSYTESAARGQITISNIRNGISVEYIIGQQAERRLFPYLIEKYRFETLLLNKITDPSTKTRFSAMYTKIDMNDPDELARNLTGGMDELFPVLAKWDASTADRTFTSQGYADKMEGSYTGRMSIYVLAQEKTTETEKNWIERQIREYSPEYTFDDLAYDHELTEYEAKAEKMPVFRMALEYRIEDDGFTVRLPASSILFDESSYRLNSIKVLPYMGAGYNDNTGYIVIPDGSGSIIRFEDYVNREVIFNTGTLYGLDNSYHTPPSTYTGQTEKMRFPVYGIVENTEKSYVMDKNGNAQEVCPHRWLEATVEPNCAYADPITGKIIGKNGYKYMYCAVCGERGEITQVIPFTHTERPGSKQAAVVDVNCVTKQVDRYTCSVCEQHYFKYADNPPVRDHQYGAGLIVDAENHTCTELSWCTNSVPKLDENGNIIPILNEKGEYQYENGKLKIERVDCHTIKEKYDDAHEFSDEYIYDKDEHICFVKHTCTQCGYEAVETAEHTYGEPSYTTGAGDICITTEVCEHCGYTKVTTGLHVCNDLTAEKQVDTVKHRCYYVLTCETCHKTFEEEAEHKIENGVCIDCGYTVPTVAGHQLAVAYLTVGDKCYRTFKCTDEGCDYELPSARVEVPHLYEAKVIPATCTENGCLSYECTHCGFHAFTEVLEEVPANGHKYNHESTQQNCTDPYTTLDRCVKCGEVANEQQHEGGHTYGKSTVIEKETTTNDGIYCYVCTYKDCGHVHYEIVPKIVVEEPEEGDDPATDEDDPSDNDTPAEPAESIKTTTVTHGFLAVITSGSALATLEAGYGGSVNGYNYAYMIVTPRPSDSYNLKDSMAAGEDKMWTVVSKRKYTGSYTLKLYMLQSVSEDTPKTVGYSNSEIEASYVGMATAYREHLIKSGALTALEQTTQGIPLYLEAFGAINISSSFLTFPTTKKIPLTTFDDLESIANELKSLKDASGNDIGISNIQFRLKGYTNGGIYSTMPYKVKFEKVVGGNDGFKEFVSYAKDNDLGVFPDFDFANKLDSEWFDGFDADEHLVKTIDGRYISKKDYYAPAQMFTVVGARSTVVSASVYDYFYTTFQKNYSKFGNTGISASTLGTDLNSDFDEDEPYNREDSREFTEKILERMKNDYASVMVDGGNAYTVKYADHILNMSLSGSKHLTTSSSIPFISMVLHGYVNYAGEPTNMASSMNVELLHIIENGASPYFIIATQNTRYVKEHWLGSQYYSLDYSTWKEDIIESYTILNEALKDVQFATFTAHEYVTANRLPDRDEISDDYLEARTAIIKAIEKLEAAELRKDNALALYNRKAVEEPEKYRQQIRELVAAYVSAGEIATDDEQTVMTAKINALLALIDECLDFSKRGGNLHRNISVSEKAYETALADYMLTMSKYSYLFNIPEGQERDISVYKNRDNYVGSYYIDEQGKYVFTSEGLVDSEGNSIRSAYTINNNSVVRVGYSNGVEFYLNYNYFDVVVKIGNENVLIKAYSFYKHTA